MSLLAMPLALNLVLIGTAFVAAAYDLRVRRIPNWINLTGLVFGLVLNWYFAGSGGVLTALGGFLAALCIYLPLYAVKGMGAGDVKLMAAIGSIAGPMNWLGIFLATALLGGVASLILVAWRRRTNETLLNIGVILGRLARGKQPSHVGDPLSIYGEKSLKMPHGAIIAAGVGIFLVMHWSR